MSLWIVLRENGQQRRIDLEEEPISIGGQDATLPFDLDPGPGDAPVAMIGSLGGKPFVQPNPDAARDPAGEPALYVNETRATASRWLEGSGQIRVGPLRIAFAPKGSEWQLRIESLETPNADRAQIVERIEYRPGEGDAAPGAAAPARAGADASGGFSADPGTTRPAGGSAKTSVGAAPTTAASPAAAPTRGQRRRRFLAFAGAVLIGALLFAFSFFRSIGLATAPPAEQILVEGGTAIRFAGRWWMTDGRYSVRASRKGYAPFESTLQIERDQDFLFSLEPLPGRLSVETRPVTDASIWINEVRIGKAPLDDWSLPAGPISVRAEAPLHRDAEVQFEIAGLGQSQQLTVELEPAWARIEIESKPPGATLLLDRRAVGITPAAVQAGEGQRTLELRLPGYIPWTETIEVKAEQPQRMGPIALEPERISAPAPRPAQTAKAARPAPKASPPRIQAEDGSELILVRGGEVRMGTARGQQGRRRNEPERSARLTRPFYLASKEITNAQFSAFRKRHDSGYLRSIPLRGPQQPVVRISWQDAAAYCNWLSAKAGLPLAYRQNGKRLEPVSPLTTGYRLPTEAEWTLAVRGSETRRYPWGKGFPPPRGVGNLGDRTAASLLSGHLANLDDGHGVSAPVGAYAPNRAGFYDLTGNVAEWMHDAYSPDGSGGNDPTGPAAGSKHVVRGSSYRDSSITKLRIAYRNGEAQPRDDLGFRIARYADERE